MKCPFLDSINNFLNSNNNFENSKQKWELQFRLSTQIIFLNLNLKNQIEILIFRIGNNNLGFKYQFLDQTRFLNLNIKFQIQIMF